MFPPKKLIALHRAIPQHALEISPSQTEGLPLRFKDFSDKKKLQPDFVVIFFIAFDYFLSNKHPFLGGAGIFLAFTFAKGQTGKTLVLNHFKNLGFASQPWKNYSDPLDRPKIQNHLQFAKNTLEKALEKYHKTQTTQEKNTRKANLNHRINPLENPRKAQVTLETII